MYDNPSHNDSMPDYRHTDPVNAHRSRNQPFDTPSSLSNALADPGSGNHWPPYSNSRVPAMDHSGYQQPNIPSTPSVAPQQYGQNMDVIRSQFSPPASSSHLDAGLGVGQRQWMQRVPNPDSSHWPTATQEQHLPNMNTSHFDPSLAWTGQGTEPRISGHSVPSYRGNTASSYVSQLSDSLRLQSPLLQAAEIMGASNPASPYLHQDEAMILSRPARNSYPQSQHDVDVFRQHSNSPTSSAVSFEERPGSAPSLSTQRTLLPTGSVQRKIPGISVFDSKPYSKRGGPGSPNTGKAADDKRRHFRCSDSGCDREFTSLYTLRLHMESHKSKERASFQCTMGCSSMFSRRHDRLRHEVTQHGRVCEWTCPRCGRFFSTQQTLMIHKCPSAST